MPDSSRVDEAFPACRASLSQKFALSRHSNASFMAFSAPCGEREHEACLSAADDRKTPAGDGKTVGTAAGPGKATATADRQFIVRDRTDYVLG